MSEEIITVMGEEYEKGFINLSWECPPETLIVKIQGSLVGTTLSLSVVVNYKMAGELFFTDTTEVTDGDTVWAEPDGLTVLKAGGILDQIEPIGDDYKVQIGSYFDGTFLTHPTTEP
jgi:hypothetical protein